LSPNKIGEDPLESIDTGARLAQSNAGMRPRLSRSSDLRKLIGSLTLTLLSVGMLVGGFLLSQANQPSVAPSPTNGAMPAVDQPLATPSPSATLSPTRIPDTATATFTPTPPTATLTDTATPEPSATLVPPTATTQETQPVPAPTECIPRADWFAYTVQPGDTLFSISRRCSTEVAVVRQGNCLANNTIYTGQPVLLPCVPLQPTLRPTSAPAPTQEPIQESPSVTPPGCTRPTIVEFYAALPSEGSSVRFVLHWTIQGADRSEIYGHAVDPHSGTFDVWDSEAKFWVLWAKINGTPDDCYAEQTIWVDPSTLD